MKFTAKRNLENHANRGYVRKLFKSIFIFREI